MTKRIDGHIIILDEHDAEVISSGLSALCELVFDILARRQMALVRPTETANANVIPLKRAKATPKPPLEELF